MSKVVVYGEKRRRKREVTALKIFEFENFSSLGFS